MNFLLSVPSLLALGIVAVLALFPDARVLSPENMAPDRAALWFLLGSALLLQIPALWKRLVASRDGATWALLCVGFVLFQLAERAGPREGFALTLPFAPDDRFVVSWATWAVVVGALLSIPLWLKKSGVERFVLLALLLVGAFGWGTTRFLANFFPVGATETLDPGPMASLVLQVVSYAALALCCRAASTNEQVRPFVLRVLTALLFLVVARHQFAPIAPVPTDE